MAVEEQQVDGIGEVLAQGLPGVALADVDHPGQPRLLDNPARGLDLAGLVLGADHDAAALSWTAAASCSSDTPNDVPNSTTARARRVRASM